MAKQTAKREIPSVRQAWRHVLPPQTIPPQGWPNYPMATRDWSMFQDYVLHKMDHEALATKYDLTSQLVWARLRVAEGWAIRVLDMNQAREAGLRHF